MCFRVSSIGNIERGQWANDLTGPRKRRVHPIAWKDTVKKKEVNDHQYLTVYQLKKSKLILDIWENINLERAE